MFSYAKDKKDISQTVIIDKLTKYVNIQAKKDPTQKRYNPKDKESFLKLMNKGECSGLSALWLYLKPQDLESSFFGKMNLISQWDGEEKSLMAGDRFLE